MLLIINKVEKTTKEVVCKVEWHERLPKRYVQTSDFRCGKCSFGFDGKYECEAVFVDGILIYMHSYCFIDSVNEANKLKDY